MMKEIPGYEGQYWINESGVIINGTGHVMRSGRSNTGYLRVPLKNKNTNTRKSELVHRLVALAFLDNPDGLNNHVSNLKWATQLENNVRTHGSEETKRKKIVHQYEIYTLHDSVICKDRQELSDMTTYSLGALKKMVGNGTIIKYGPYAGYKIRRVDKIEH